MQKIGSLLYVTIITWPDAAKAANKLAEFAINPGPKHLDAVNHAIAYLYSTCYYTLEYSVNCAPEEVFLCVSDAAYGDLTGWKSSQGYLCKLFGIAIDWQASKQHTVIISTTEAELLAISEAGKSILWWKHLTQLNSTLSMTSLSNATMLRQLIFLRRKIPNCTPSYIMLTYIIIDFAKKFKPDELQSTGLSQPRCQQMALSRLFLLNTMQNSFVCLA